MVGGFMSAYEISRSNQLLAKLTIWIHKASSPSLDILEEMLLKKRLLFYS